MVNTENGGDTNIEAIIYRLGVDTSQFDKALNIIADKLEAIENKSNSMAKSMGNALNAPIAATNKLSGESNKLAKELNDSKNQANQLKSGLQGLKSEQVAAATGAAKHKTEVQGLNTQLNEAKRSTNSFGGSLRSLTGIVSFAVLAAGFVAVAKASMEAEETQNLFTVSMGNMTKEARQWSDTLANNLGLNVVDLQKNLGTLNVMLKGMNFDDKGAMEMSQSLTKLAYDLSSFFNIRPEEAFNKIRSGIIGESEPLRQLGVIITETTVKNALLTHGIKTQGKQLTEQEKIMGRYLVIMDSTRAAQGDLERTADSTTNMLRRLEAQSQTLARETGQYLTPAIDDAVQMLLHLTERGRAFLQAEGPELGALFANLSTSITSFNESLDSTDFSILIEGLKAVATTANVVSGGLQTIVLGLQMTANAAEGLQRYNDRQKISFQERQSIYQGYLKQTQAKAKSPMDWLSSTMKAKKLTDQEIAKRENTDKIFNDWKKQNYETITGYQKSINKIQDSITDIAMGSPLKRQEQYNKKLKAQLNSLVNAPQIKSPGMAVTPEKAKKPKVTDTERALRREQKELLEKQFEQQYLKELGAGGLSINVPLTLLPKVDEISYSKLGLSQETVTKDFKDMYERLHDLRQDYNKKIDQENEKQSEILKQAGEKQLAIEKKYLEDRAKLKAKLKADLIQASEGEGTEAQKKQLQAMTFDSAAIDKQELERDYRQNIIELEEATKKQILDIRKKQNQEISDLNERETKLLASELDKQKEARQELEADNQEQIVATFRLKEDTLIRRQMLAAKVSKDEIAQINLEYRASENSLKKEIDLINLKVAARQKELQVKIQTAQDSLTIYKDPKEQEEIRKNIKAMQEEQILIAMEGNEQIKDAEQSIHEAKMAMIEKENDAMAEQFEKQLGFLEKVLGLVGKIAGKDSFVGKMAGMLGQYKSTIADVFKMFLSNKTASKLQESGALPMPLMEFAGGGISGQITGAAANLATSGIENLGNIFGNINSKQAKLAGSGVGAIADLGEALKGSASTSVAGSGGKIGGLRNLLGIGKPSSLMGSLGGAAAGGLAGYAMGSEAGPLGMLGGVASGGLTGFMMGGPIGAAIGGGVGLIGGLLSWLFGGRSKKEMKRLDSVTKTAEAGLAESNAALTGVQGAASRAKLINELQDVKSRADAAMSQVLQQESYMLTEMNPNNFKSKKARRAAAQAQSDMAQKVFEQKQAAEELQRQAAEALRQRQNTIEDMQRSLYAEGFKLGDAAVSDPFRFSGEEFYGQQLDSTAKYTQTVREFGDDPQILEMARKARLAEMKIIQRQGELNQVEKGGNQVRFYSEVEQETLKANDAGSIEMLEAEKKEALETLRFDMQKLRIEMGDNQELLTKVTELEASKRKNIEKDYQEQIRAEYEKTAGSLADLLKRRDEIAGQFDFKRSKSRVDIIREQLAEVDAEIRKQWKSGIDNLKGVTTESMQGMDSDQLTAMQKEVQAITNFSNSKAFNNVININVPEGTSGDMINSIAASIQTVLANQARLVTT